MKQLETKMTFVGHISKGSKTAGSYTYCKPRSTGTGVCPLYPNNAGNEHHAEFKNKRAMDCCNKAILIAGRLESLDPNLVPKTKAEQTRNIIGFMHEKIQELQSGGDADSIVNAVVPIADEIVSATEAEQARRNGKPMSLSKRSVEIKDSSGWVRKSVLGQYYWSSPDGTDMISDTVHKYYNEHPDVDLRNSDKLVIESEDYDYDDAMSDSLYPNPVSSPTEGFEELYNSDLKAIYGYGKYGPDNITKSQLKATISYTTEQYRLINNYMRAESHGDSREMTKLASRYRKQTGMDIADTVSNLHDYINAEGGEHDDVTVFRVDFHPTGNRSKEEMEYYRAAKENRPVVCESFLSTTMQDPNTYQSRMRTDDNADNGAIFCIRIPQGVPARPVKGVNSFETEVLLDSSTQLRVNRIIERSALDPESPTGWSGKGPIIMLEAVTAEE